MLNIHYFAVVADTTQPSEPIGIFLVPARKIIGSLYTPSSVKAQKYLNQHHPGARALKASACSKQEQAGTYEVLIGQPTDNTRGAGRKSTGHTVKLTLNGVNELQKAKLEAEAKGKNRSAYVVGLIDADLLPKSKNADILIPAEVAEGYNSQSPTERGETYSIGQQIEKDGNLVLYEILSTICKKHQTSWFDGELLITTEYGEYQDTNHAKVLLMAIRDAIAALNVKEPRVVDDDDNYL